MNLKEKYLENVIRLYFEGNGIEDSINIAKEVFDSQDQKEINKWIRHNFRGVNE